MNIRFIVNPASGKNKANVQDKITCIKTVFPDAEVVLTQRPGHATELAREAAAHNAKAVIAVGGDGTLNEAARGLVHTLTPLGIIPSGSGNGFARELGMDLSFKKAVQQIRRMNVMACDVGHANNHLFLNVAGVGLEAEIAWQFMEHGKNGLRGKWPYFKLGAELLFSYQPLPFEMHVAEKKSYVCPLTLTFANGKQYGSNFKIAPQASLHDGLLDMVAVQNLPKWKLAVALPSFFMGQQPPLEVTQTTQINHVLLMREGTFPFHVDGEPHQAENSLEISVAHKALKILLPEQNNAR
ncbi:MAG: diacylglycerol kinase family lipid kinase [Elusimicrobiaceae bacterium]|nr:diacylglycerol kinase family lipid kinase [Elusimicrobiaceae bacterium]